MDFRTPDPAVVNLSKKEALLHRISQHIEQAQVSSPAYSLSNLAQKGSEEVIFSCSVSIYLFFVNCRVYVIETTCTRKMVPLCDDVT